MSVSQCSWTVIDGNIVDITITGMDIYDCEGLEVAFNTVSSTQGDIVVDASTEIYILNNTLDEGDCGVELYDSTYIYVWENIVTPSSRFGGPPREYTSKRARASTLFGNHLVGGVEMYNWSTCNCNLPLVLLRLLRLLQLDHLLRIGVLGWTCRRATRCTGTTSRTACSCSSTLRTTS